jgi:multisubunit Na+/H+ antiporter MnhG subunit
VTTARDYVLYVLVALGVGTELVACLGLAVMRSAIDRLHYAAAGCTLGPAFVAAAVCVREGVESAQGLAAILIAVVLALAGSTLGAATSRVIRLDTHGTLESSPAERERVRP